MSMGGRIRSLRRDGLTFDVFDEGPLRGEIAVLLHGFPERSTMWRHVAPRLHERGVRTLALDQRGYSPGARPTRRRDYRLASLCDDAAALITQVGGPVHLVGHDWGAVVAWTLASRDPGLVRTLTAVSVPHPMAFLMGALTSKQALRSWYILGFQLPRLPELSARHRGGGFDRGLLRAGMTEEEVTRFRTEIVDYGALPGGIAWYRAIARVDHEPPSRKVTVPTTFVWSDGDLAVDRRSAERAVQYVVAPFEFVELPGVSHWIPTQAPEACADAILRRIGSV